MCNQLQRVNIVDLAASSEFLAKIRQLDFVDLGFIPQIMAQIKKLARVKTLVRKRKVQKMSRQSPDKDHPGWPWLDESYLQNIKSNSSVNSRGKNTIYITDDTLFRILRSIENARSRQYSKDRTNAAMKMIVAAHKDGIKLKIKEVSEDSVNRYIKAAIDDLGLDLKGRSIGLFCFVITYRVNRSLAIYGGDVESLGLFSI